MHYLHLPPAGAHTVALKRAYRDGHQLCGVRLSAVLLHFTVMLDCWCTQWPAFDPLAATTGHQFDACLLRSFSEPGSPSGGERGGSIGGPAKGQSGPCTEA